MPFDPLRHHRRSIRLRRYNYSAEGGYFVTICTRNRECTLGDIVEGKMVLSELGRIAEEYWRAIPNVLQNVMLDEYQIMPNHIHGILVILDVHVDDVDKRLIVDFMGKVYSARDLINQIPPGHPILLGFENNKFTNDVDWPSMKNPRNTLGKTIRHFKAKATKVIRDAGFLNFEWQKGYHDHIIRDEPDLQRIRRYIRSNPLRWLQSD